MEEFLKVSSTVMRMVEGTLQIYDALQLYLATNHAIFEVAPTPSVLEAVRLMKAPVGVWWNRGYWLCKNHHQTAIHVHFLWTSLHYCCFQKNLETIHFRVSTFYIPPKTWKPDFSDIKWLWQNLAKIIHEPGRFGGTYTIGIDRLEQIAPRPAIWMLLSLNFRPLGVEVWGLFFLFFPWKASVREMEEIQVWNQTIMFGAIEQKTQVPISS